MWIITRQYVIAKTMMGFSMSQIRITIFENQTVVSDKAIRITSLHFFDRGIFRHFMFCRQLRSIKSYVFPRDHISLNAISPLLRGIRVCEPGWTLFSNNCYKHIYNVNNRVTYAEAQAQCVARNSYVTTVASPEERDFVQRKIRSLVRKYWIIFRTGSSAG